MVEAAIWKIVDLGAFGGLVVIFLFGIYKVVPQIREVFEGLTRSIDKLDDGVSDMSETIKEEIRKQGMITRRNLASNSFSDEEIIDKATDKVLAKSFEKLAYLREVLIRNSLQKREKQIKENIRVSLIRFSNDYIKQLNTERHRLSTGALMGDWIAENFPMESFLEELYEIFFRITDDDIAIERHNKINDIKVLMIDTQEKMWTDLKSKLLK